MEYRFPDEGFEVCDSTNQTTGKHKDWEGKQNEDKAKQSITKQFAFLYALVICLRKLQNQYQSNGLNCSEACPATCK